MPEDWAEPRVQRAEELEMRPDTDTGVEPEEQLALEQLDEPVGEQEQPEVEVLLELEQERQSGFGQKREEPTERKPAWIGPTAEIVL